MKWIIYICLYGIYFTSKAQVFHSTICDSTTKHPLPGASVYVRIAKMGTITNNDGRFSIKLKGKETITVSYIGYNTKVFNAQNMPDTIWLSESNLLNEVVVIPDSSLKVLLRKAYGSIEKNYAQKPTYLTGFYREVFENLSAQKFNYFSESFLKVYHPAYTKKGAEHEGQLKLLKSRTIKHPDFQKQTNKYIGGPFLPIFRNKVLRRTQGINPKYFKNYVYELEKITTYQGREVYIINYQNRDSTTKAKVYIDKQSLAYIKFEIEREQERMIGGFKQKTIKEQLLFDNRDTTWFLKHDKLEMYGTAGVENAKILLEFVTNKYEEDSVEQFSYKEQFLITDVIADQTNDFSNSFFEGYDVGLEQTKDLKKQIQLAFNTNLLDSLKNGKEEASAVQYQTAKKLNIINFLMRFSGGIGLSFLPIATKNADFVVILTDILPEKISLTSTTSTNNLPLLANSNLTFKLNRRWYLQYYNQTSIQSNTRIKGIDFGVAYRWVFNNSRKPIFVEPHLYYSRLEYGVRFNSFENTVKCFEIDGKKFNANNIHTRLLNETQGIKIGLSISTFSRRLSKLFVQVDYFHSLKTKDPYLQLQEASFWGYIWGNNRSTNMPLNDARIEMPASQIYQMPTLKNNWWISLIWRRTI